MITKEITFEDFNGIERKETHYFHINKAELTALNFTMKGGLTGVLKEIEDTQDVNSLVALVDKFIDLSYGKKSADGLNFRKKPEYLEDFKSSNAYEAFYMELLSDVNNIINFINGVVPSDVLAKAKEIEANGGIDPNHPALKK